MGKIYQWENIEGQKKHNWQVRAKMTTRNVCCLMQIMTLILEECPYWKHHGTMAPSWPEASAFHIFFTHTQAFDRNWKLVRCSLTHFISTFSVALRASDGLTDSHMRIEELVQSVTIRRQGSFLLPYSAARRGCSRYLLWPGTAFVHSRACSS